MTAARKPCCSSWATPLDGGAARGAHRVLHGAGVLACGQVELSGARQHLGRQPVGKLPGQAVVDARVPQGLQEQGGVGRAAARHRPRDAHLGRGHCLPPRPKRPAAPLPGRAPGARGCSPPPAAQCLPNSHRGVGLDAEMVHPRGQHLLKPLEGPARRHREQHLARQLLRMGGAPFLLNRALPPG